MKKEHIKVFSKTNGAVKGPMVSIVVALSFCHCFDIERQKTPETFLNFSIF